VFLAVECIIYVGFAVTRNLNKEAFHIFFSPKDEYISALVNSKGIFDEYSNVYFDHVKGWENSRNRAFSGEDCAGAWNASYDENGARRTGSNDALKDYAVVCVGDSFTHGNGVEDTGAYPSALEKLTGLRVGNFGVGGYDVTQSVLQYGDVLKNSKMVKIGVLGILYEGGRRNLNSFRPVMTNSSGDMFYFKPYFKDGKLMHNALSKGSSLDTIPGLAAEAFASDYWAKPDFKFPYVISLLKSIATPSVVFAVAQKMNHIVGVPTYSYDFSHRDILDSLRYSIDEFMMISKNNGVYPVVVFIPANLKDRSSPDVFVKEIATVYPESMVLNFGSSNAEWGRYMIKAGCHPTEHGYFELAKYIATNLESKQLLK
jgi:hypothetical protein